MAQPGAEIAAARLEARLKSALGHDQIQVRPHGAHLLVALLSGNEADTIARLTALTGTSYTAGFRNQAGRWEALPINAPLDTAADELADLIRPFLSDPRFI